MLQTVGLDPGSVLSLGFFALGASELLPEWERETVKRRVLTAEQVIFAGAELNFQPSGDNGITLEFSLSLLEKFNWNVMNEDCVQCISYTLCLTTARINLVRSTLEHTVATDLESNRGPFFSWSGCERQHIIIWGDVSIPWRQPVGNYMSLILENNDVKVKQEQKGDREQVFAIVLRIYCRYKEHIWEHAS